MWPSASKAAAATPPALPPPSKITAGWKPPLPFARRMNTSPAPTARSGLPSSSKSAMAIDCAAPSMANPSGAMKAGVAAWAAETNNSRETAKRIRLMTPSLKEGGLPARRCWRAGCPPSSGSAHGVVIPTINFRNVTPAFFRACQAGGMLRWVVALTVAAVSGVPLTVRVLDENRQPLAGIQVNLFRVADNAESGSVVFFDDNPAGETNAQGLFETRV